MCSSWNIESVKNYLISKERFIERDLNVGSKRNIGHGWRIKIFLLLFEIKTIRSYCVLIYPDQGRGHVFPRVEDYALTAESSRWDAWRALWRINATRRFAITVRESARILETIAEGDEGRPIATEPTAESRTISGTLM